MAHAIVLPVVARPGASLSPAGAREAGSREPDSGIERAKYKAPVSRPSRNRGCAYLRRYAGFFRSNFGARAWTTTSDGPVGRRVLGSCSCWLVGCEIFKTEDFSVGLD